jgi:hypothetical protein
MTQWKPTDGTFNLTHLYHLIVKTLSNNADGWVADTLAWWQRQAGSNPSLCPQGPNTFLSQEALRRRHQGRSQEVEEASDHSQHDLPAHDEAGPAVHQCRQRAATASMCLRHSRSRPQALNTHQDTPLTYTFPRWTQRSIPQTQRGHDSVSGVVRHIVTGLTDSWRWAGPRGHGQSRQPHRRTPG